LILGLPETIDINSFLSHLKKIKDFHSVCSLPIYDRNLHNPRENAILVEKEKTKVVIIEGLFLLSQRPGFCEILPLLDVSIFLETDMELCRWQFSFFFFLMVSRTRLVERKVRTGRDRKMAERHFDNVDRKSISHIEESKHLADLVIKFEGYQNHIRSISQRTKH